MLTKKERMLLDSFYNEMRGIKPPKTPYKQEDFEKFFIEKYSKQVFFEYLFDNLPGHSPKQVIVEFIATTEGFLNMVHKDTILVTCLKEEKRFAQEVLKALSS